MPAVPRLLPLHRRRARHRRGRRPPYSSHHPDQRARPRRRRNLGRLGNLRPPQVEKAFCPFCTSGSSRLVQFPPNQSCHRKPDHKKPFNYTTLSRPKIFSRCRIAALSPFGAGQRAAPALQRGSRPRYNGHEKKAKSSDVRTIEDYIDNDNQNLMTSRR